MMSGEGGQGGDDVPVEETHVALDDQVCEYLRLDEPRKRAFHLYLAGLTHLIYAEASNGAWLYSKVKLFKRRAEDLLIEAHGLDPQNPYCAFHLALTCASLSRPILTLTYLQSAPIQSGPLYPSAVAL
jgi:hypothetical protein